MKVEILTRVEAESIDPDEWDDLAKNSYFTNPFFERWSLLPALQNLQKEEDVYIVIATKDNQLFSLFPIRVRQHFLGANYMSDWEHDHCFLSDPLCRQPVLLSKVITLVNKRMGSPIFQLHCHSPHSYGRYIHDHGVTNSETRGAVLRTELVSEHLVNLPRKVRLENKRIKKRFFEIEGAKYITSQNSPDIDWLGEYCRLEHSGWKGREECSILSLPEVKCYYESMLSMARNNGAIEFQGLFIEDQAQAISFRMVTNNKAYEIKTSYLENGSKLYAGVVLELMNLEEISKSNFTFVDSCTSSDNYLINRLWPDQIKVCTSLYFQNHISGKLLKFLYKVKNKFYSTRI